MSIERKRILAVATALTMATGIAVYIGLLSQSTKVYDYANERQITAVSLNRLKSNNTVETLHKGKPVFFHLLENGDPVVLEGIAKVPFSSINYIVKLGPGTLKNGETYTYYSDGHGTFYKANGEAIQTYKSMKIEDLSKIEYEVLENQVVIAW